MPEELHLVTELAIILIAAGVFTIISKALKQPLILGYIVAGFIVGPHLGLFPQFSPDSIHEWSELGITFLLFGLGLEFSFKKLLEIGGSAFITSAVKCIGMFIIGMIVGHLMGWTSMECIFLGGLLGMSSTTIIIKAYEDLGYKDKPFATLIFGSLVFEDLIAVLLLVLLSTIAVTGKFEGGQMLFALAKLAFFIILWFVVGLYIIPILLKKARNYLSDEILLLVSVGLCFLMVVLANLAGFSSALGTFVMGSLLAETLEGERIVKVTSTLKDLFGAIFFVSVGMMLDPAIVAQHWLPILIITLVVIVGILFISTFGVLLAGKGLDTAVHAGFSLCQLGEFAFIIASLGCTLGVMRDFIYPVIIAVSVITTFTTPYMIRFGDPVSAWLHKVLPAKVLAVLEPPQTYQMPESLAEKNEWKKLLGNLFLRIVLYGVPALAVMIGFHHLLPQVFDKFFPEVNDVAESWISMAVTLIFAAPLLYGIALSGKDIRTTAGHLIKKNSHNAWGILAVILLRLTIPLIFVIQTIEMYFSLSWWSILLLIVSLVAAYFLMRKYLRSFTFFEERFIRNLNAREMEERKVPVNSIVNEALAAYNVSLMDVQVSPDFAFLGKTLREMPFRKNSGANILKIQRGSRSIIIPSGDEIVYPGDSLLAVGTPEQLNLFSRTMRDNTIISTENQDSEFTVEIVRIGEESSLAGKNLRELNMRSSGCMTVSVLRDGQIITNPHADFVFEVGDVAWIAGEKSSIEWFR